MIKNRNTISYSKINKRSIRPLSSTSLRTNNRRPSLQINQIISTLEKNVKDLKTYYNGKDAHNRHTISLQKNKNGFRTRKILRRNSSQSNLQPIINEKNQDKSVTDVFQIKNYFMKVNGRDTNSIVELYQFYKKNMEKRQKSTRILASMEISNPNMGQSYEMGKQSLLKHDYCQYSKKDLKQTSKIQERQQEISRLQNTGKGIKKNEKPSSLAFQLLSKGYYNLSNVANLLNNKKYRLTKQKQQSFQMQKILKEKVNMANEVHCKDMNKQNSMQNSNKIKTEQQQIEKIKQLKQNMDKLKNAEYEQAQHLYKQEISFKQCKSPTIMQKQEPNQRSLQCSSVHSSSKKHSSKKKNQAFAPKQTNQHDSNSKKLKIDQLSELAQSPIVVKKQKQFTRSKYYVQPIPIKNGGLSQQESISLKSPSRLIDLELIPFDL